ncbi:MAG: FecCD family ABC transporter permease [Thiohalomonadaceae bacterium]
MTPRLTASALLPLLALLALGSLLAALAAGSVALSPAELFAALGGEPGLARDVVLELRLPRALTAFAVGGLLALAGALMQVLLGNPLADPYVLGVSGGAAVGALLALLLGLAGVTVTAGAFFGALVSIVLVFGLAHSRGERSPTRLLLTGVVMAAGWGAGINLLLTLAPDAPLRGMLFWLMGDLSQAGFPGAGLAVLAVGVAATLPFARDLNLLARGELQAGALGVSVGRLRLHLYLVASLLTAAAVTLGGSIGFVGLIIPHLLRLLAGSDHRMLLPASVLAGGALLTAADTLARTALAPQQLPVGVLTALLGVPVFLYLLTRSGR